MALQVKGKVLSIIEVGQARYPILKSSDITLPRVLLRFDSDLAGRHRLHDYAFVSQWIEVVNDALEKRDDKVKDTKIRDIMVRVQRYIELPRKRK